MYRQIVIPNDTELLLHIPKHFVGQKVEVIAFPVESGEKTTPVKKKQIPKKISKETEAFYRSINIDMSKFKFDREEAHAR
jgi:hypothetical protein